MTSIETPDPGDAADSGSADSGAADSASTESGGVKLVVDQEKCIGSGQCEMLEEATFLVDDEGSVTASVIGTGRLPVDRANKVVDLCPSQAISIVDSGS